MASYLSKFMGLFFVANLLILWSGIVNQAVLNICISLVKILPLGSGSYCFDRLLLSCSCPMGCVFFPKKKQIMIILFISWFSCNHVPSSAAIKLGYRGYILPLLVSPLSCITYVNQLHTPSGSWVVIYSLCYAVFGETLSMCKCLSILFLCCSSVCNGLWLYNHQWYWTQVGAAWLLPINQPRLILNQWWIMWLQS